MREGCQQLVISFRQPCGGGSKVCEEGICESRHKFLEVRIEELRVFLKGFELAGVRKVKRKVKRGIPS